MKNYIATILFLFAFTISTTSCRENKERAADDDADDEIENTIQEGVNEVQENTGTGGTDDN